MTQEPLVREAEVAAFRDAVLTKLTYAVGKDPDHAFDHDWFEAIALAARDHMVEHWMDHTRRTYRDGRKRVYYFSLEFLIGRMLFDSAVEPGTRHDPARAALAELGVDFDRLRTLEPDAALGNGGLGRLAACFMESMATLGIPAHGYGIRYDHGIFRQVLMDGWQNELPEEWLAFGNPWEFERPEVMHTIGFGGQVETVTDEAGKSKQVWHPAETVRAIAYDTPVVGWRGASVNTLRLWRARGHGRFAPGTLQRRRPPGRASPKWPGPKVSPACSTRRTAPKPGQELRLRQEYFFVAASPAGFAAPPSQHAHLGADPGRSRGDPAQRHPPRRSPWPS